MGPIGPIGLIGQTETLPTLATLVPTQSVGTRSKPAPRNGEDANATTDPAVQRPVDQSAAGRVGAAGRGVGLPGRGPLLLGRSLRGPARRQPGRLLRQQTGAAQSSRTGRSHSELSSR